MEEKIPRSVGVSICLHCGFKTLYQVVPTECNNCARENLVIKQYTINEVE